MLTQKPLLKVRKSNFPLVEEITVGEASVSPICIRMYQNSLDSSCSLDRSKIPCYTLIMIACPRCKSTETKKWYLIPEEAMRICYKCYKRREREKYKSKMIMYRRNYYSDRKDSILTKGKAYAKTPAGKYSILLSRSKQKFGAEAPVITREEHDNLINGECHYCSATGELGVDRADNSQSYTLLNSRPCCPRCNYIKRDILTEDEMLHLMRNWLSGEQFNKIDYPLSQPPLVRDRSGSRYWKLERRSISAGIELRITRQEYERLIIENQNKCHYCTAELSTHGYCLDRKDSRVGYLLDNVVTCCSFCNAFKLDVIKYDEARIMIAILQRYHEPRGTIPKYSANHKVKQ